MSQNPNRLDELRIDRTEQEADRGGGGRIAVVLAVLLLAVLAGCWVAVGRIPKVRTVAVREAGATGGSRAVLNASGYVVARRQATISSKVTGKVVEVLVEEGMKVEAGQVLARLDDVNVVASLRLAESELDAARAALQETRARLDVARKEAVRLLKLFDQKIASPSQVDQGQAEVESLQARILYQEQQAVVGEKAVALWKQQVEDNVIRAPFSGIAVSKNAQPGEMISPISAGGGFTRTGIATVVDMSSLEIEVDVNESYLNRVHPEQPVEAALDAYPDWKIPCHVLAIIPTADRQKSTVKVRVKFNQLDPRILPDMGVKVAFLGKPEDKPAVEAVLIPEAAVRKENNRAVAWVLDNGRARARELTIASTASGEATVTAGLKAGERIIIEGPADLADGARVREKQP